MKKHEDSNEALSAFIATPIHKLYAIGEIIKGRNITPTENEIEINYGIGEILTDLAHQFEDVQEQIMDLELKVRICNIEHRFKP